MSQVSWRAATDYFNAVDAAILAHLQKVDYTGHRATEVNALNTEIVADVVTYSQEYRDVPDLNVGRFPAVYVWSGGNGWEINSVESGGSDVMLVRTRIIVWDGASQRGTVNTIAVSHIGRLVGASLSLSRDVGGSDWTDFYCNHNVPQVEAGPVEFVEIAQNTPAARQEILVTWGRREE